MTATASKQLILIDGSSYLFRAYHALPALTNSSGQPTGAIYGVVNMINKLLLEHPADYVAVVFDAKGKTFRHELFPDYKANRGEMPDELAVQIGPLHDLIRAMGLPLVMQSGVEADDIIGTYTQQAAAQKIDTLISTLDKDMAQLVNEQVTLINTMSNQQLDTQGVVEKFGVRPDQIIDYLALIGDTSDNVPGVPKVGPKTAVKWLSEYNTLENIIAHAEKFTGKVGENLRNSLDVLGLSKELVTIECEVKKLPSLHELIAQAPDVEKLKAFYQDFEFTALLKKLEQSSERAKNAEGTYHSIEKAADFERLLKQLSQATVIALDTETTSLDPMQAELVGISCAVQPDEAFYIPIAHKETDVKQLPKKQVLDALNPILAAAGKVIVGQNLKYDYKVLRNAGLTLSGTIVDTMLMSYVLNSTGTRHDMDTLALKYLGKETIKFEDVAGKGAKKLTFDYVPIDKATQYAAEDADITLQLKNKLQEKVESAPWAQKILDDIELPLVRILGDMEYHGVLIDVALLKEQSQVLSKRIDEIESRVYTLAGEQFNIASPKQLQVILFEKLSLPVLKKTPKGAPSTAEEVMQELALDYELPALILEFRQLSKLKSTYTDALPQLVNPNTKRIHTSYNQAVTSTGRLSSNHPNLQNIPVRTEAGRAIRQAFIAPAGYQIMAADYSQIELRIMAHLSEDPGLLYAFKNDIDVHSATAAEVFGVSLEAVTPDMRRSAKAINFGLLYGMSAFGLAKQLGTTRDQAQKYMDTYFQRYPNVHGYMEQARAFARENGFVETLFGRRLYIPDINASNHMRRMGAERAAINAPLQGSAADIIKRAMICVDERLKQQKLDATMIMQVHDELVFEVKKQDLDALCALVDDCMISALKMRVPLIVNMASGDNWEAAH